MAFLEEQKAIDPVIVEIDAENAFADAIIVASASSRRHARGLADGLARVCRERGYEFLGMEGHDLADWILLDFNNVVVNIFQEETRQLYRLEELWQRAARPAHREINS